MPRTVPTSSRRCSSLSPSGRPPPSRSYRPTAGSPPRRLSAATNWSGSSARCSRRCTTWTTSMYRRRRNCWTWTATRHRTARRYDSPTGGSDDRDWYDLAVEVSVGGEQVAFHELFVALAQEREFLLLPSGVYFSLDQPEFRQLRELIAEARELEDAPAGMLRVGRYQAGLWAELADLGEVTGAAAAWQASLRAILEEDVQVPLPAGLRAKTASIPARGADLARRALRPRPRRHPRRRHGPGQDRADAGADLPRPRAASRRRPVPGGRPASVVSQLGRGDAPVRPRPATSAR